MGSSLRRWPGWLIFGRAFHAGQMQAAGGLSHRCLELAGRYHIAAKHLHTHWHQHQHKHAACCLCRCPELKQWAQPAEATAQAALQSGSSVGEFYEAIGILATLHAHKVLSKDLKTQQVHTTVSLSTLQQSGAAHQLKAAAIWQLRSGCCAKPLHCLCVQMLAKDCVLQKPAL